MVDSLYIKPSSTILDLGVGSGAYTYEVFRVNGKGGKVIAVDIDQSKLELVKGTAKIGGFDVETMLANMESGIVLPDYSADYVVFANTMHQIEESKREFVASEIYRVLVPRGELLFVEWRSGSKFGPSQNLMINEKEAESIFTKLGMKIKNKLEAGDYHYAYIIEK